MSSLGMVPSCLLSGRRITSAEETLLLRFDFYERDRLSQTQT